MDVKKKRRLSSKKPAPSLTDETYCIEPVRSFGSLETQEPSCPSELNTSSLKTQDFIDDIKKARDELKHENKIWNKRLEESKMKLRDSESKLKAIHEGKDGRVILHGNRRSAYVQPPKFNLDLDEYLKDIEAIMDKAHYAVRRIIHKKKKSILTVPRAEMLLKSVMTDVDASTDSIIND